jgi:hypothetical protein
MSRPDPSSVHVLPGAGGRWVVRIGNDPATATEHPTVNVAERQAHRRASSLGIASVLVHDRYQRVHESRPLLHARTR